MSRASALLVGLALAILLLVLPYLVQTAQQREILVFLVINALVVASYRLLTLTGEWSLGHVVMVGVGAYASALFAKSWGLHPAVTLPLGALMAALVAWILSFPLFRMKGFYFLIGSFAAGEVIRLSWRLSQLRDVFGGPKGLKSIPGFGEIELFGGELAFWSATDFYYLALAVVALSLFVLWRIERSRHGLVFHALHWQDKLAESVGVDGRRYRTTALVTASFFAGIAGGLQAHYLSTVNPNMFGVGQMVDVLIWAIVGGTATFYGPLLGLAVLTVLNQLVLRQLNQWVNSLLSWFDLPPLGLNIDQARPLIYGGLLILVILFLPKGLESLVEKAKARLARRSAAREVETA